VTRSFLVNKSAVWLCYDGLLRMHMHCMREVMMQANVHAEPSSALSDKGMNHLQSCFAVAGAVTVHRDACRAASQ
jgi:hypothetical protein